MQVFHGADVVTERVYRGAEWAEESQAADAGVPRRRRCHW